MALQLDDVTVRYPRSASPAVASVALALASGEIGVLIGPSGCGKTSLLRAVCGLERCAAGRIAIGGEAVTDPAVGLHRPPELRRVGMVFQDHALFPHLSVGANIDYGLQAMPRAARRERVQQMLELVGLAGLAGRWPHQLSGGQQQRVALARALAPSPRLLLMDEPFSSLDVELRERLAQDVRTILKQHGTTALMVTHDQLEAFALGDWIGVMNQGRLAQWADAYTLYHRPATRFVAEFIGQGVFAPARIVPGSDGRAVDTPLGRLADVAIQGHGGAALAAECDLLLRADDVVHDDASPLKARIERKAFRGAEFLYTLRLASGEPLLALVPSHHNHAVGEWIGVRPDVSHVVMFPRQSG